MEMQYGGKRNGLNTLRRLAKQKRFASMYGMGVNRLIEMEKYDFAAIETRAHAARNTVKPLTEAIRSASNV